MMEDKTIAAIATGTGGGIGVVRLSGSDALAIASTVFSGRKSPLKMQGYTAALGRVHDRAGQLDQAVLLVYRAPHSYTGEDICEISCHGGDYLLNRVLNAVIEAGAVPAAAGEFTKRALLNGKLTLTEAEAVAQLVAAESRQAAGAALDAYDGALFRSIAAVTDSLADAAAHISAWIDYPEEDVEEVLVCELSRTLAEQQAVLAGLVNSFDSGRLLRDGISTAIVGSPNVGKSTLMNLLSGSQRSIVTDIPGTTRDVVEERVRLGGLLLNLADTAGIHNTDDPVERIGVALSVARLERCDLVLAVFDGSRPLDGTDISLLERLEGRAAIGLCNKSDLPRRADLDIIAAKTCAIVELAAIDGDGVDRLEHAITELVGIKKLQPGVAQLANQRQLGCVVAAVAALDEALQALSYGQTLDAVSVCLEQSIDALLELTGKKASLEVIDKVFENFCVGK